MTSSWGRRASIAILVQVSPNLHDQKTGLLRGENGQDLLKLMLHIVILVCLASCVTAAPPSRVIPGLGGAKVLTIRSLSAEAGKNLEFSIDAEDLPPKWSELLGIGIFFPEISASEWRERSFDSAFPKKSVRQLFEGFEIRILSESGAIIATRSFDSLNPNYPYFSDVSPMIIVTPRGDSSPKIRRLVVQIEIPRMTDITALGGGGEIIVWTGNPNSVWFP